MFSIASFFEHIYYSIRELQLHISVSFKKVTNKYMIVSTNTVIIQTSQKYIYSKCMLVQKLS